jgi:hypothetical protein
MPFNYAELIESNAADPDIQAVFDRLQATFPKRYLHFDVTKIRNKMAFFAEVPEVSASVQALRIWRWTDTVTASIDIVALFFLRRLGSDAPAYTMTVGVNPAVTLAVLYPELLRVCHDMAGGALSKLQVVNQRRIGTEDLLEETGGSQRVREAFDRAITGHPPNLNYKRQLVVGGPWPQDLHYWEVVNV